MKAKSSKTETVFPLTLFCGFLAFIGFGWYGLIVGGGVSTLGEFYAVSQNN